jgi:hypothetical protein
MQTNQKIGRKGFTTPILYFGLVGCCGFGRLIKYAATPAMTTMTTTTAAAINVRLLLLEEVVELDALVELELVTGGAEVDVEVVETDDVGGGTLELVADDVSEMLVEVAVETPCARLSPQN